MIKKFYRTFLSGVIAAVAVVMLAGCAKTEKPVTENPVTENPAVVEDVNKDDSNKNNETTEPEVVENEVTYPITITHAFGETVIEEKPERVATIAWGNQDVPLALGVVPVGASKANFGVSDDSGLLPWTATAVTELAGSNIALYDETDGIDFEAISDTQPDVILLSYSGITAEEYALLTEIAPVVPYAEKPWETFWRDQTITNATAMGMETEGKKLVEEAEALIAAKAAEYGVEGMKAAFFWINAADLGTFYVYLPQDPRGAYLEDLGLVFPKSLSALATPESGIALTLSAENADVLTDLDIIITYGTQDLVDALQADPVLSQVPAIKNGAIVLLDGTSSLAASATPSILSIPSTIDEYLGLIQEAAQKVQ